MPTKVILATPPLQQLTTSPETHRSFNHTRRAADSKKEGKQELARRKYADDDYCPLFENNGWADEGVMDEWING